MLVKFMLFVLLLLYLATAITSRIFSVTDFEPYTLLKRDDLTHIFALDGNCKNQLLPSDKGSCINVATRFSNDAIMSNSSYIEGNGCIGFSNTEISPSSYSLLTIGAWVKLTSTDARANDVRYLFSHSKSHSDSSNCICERGVYLSDTWNLCHGCDSEGGALRSQITSITPTFNRWSFVAVSYDQHNHKAQLYVDGQSASFTDFSAPSNLGDLILGSNNKYCRKESSSTLPDSQGINGLMDNIFIYKSFLTSEELQFIQLTSSKRESIEMTLPSASSAGFAAHFSEIFAIKVPASPMLSGFSQFSVTFWIQFKDISSSYLVVADKSDNGPEYKISFQDDSALNSRSILVNIGSNSDSPRSKTGDVWGITWQFPLINQLDSDWHHVGVTWDGKFVRVYLDGTLAKSLDFVVYQADRRITDGINLSIRDFSSNLFIGRSFQAPGYKRDFLLDSLSIWNSAIVCDSSCIYFSPTQLFSPHLVALFPFDEGYGLYSKSKSFAYGAVVGTWTPLLTISRDGSEKFASNNFIASSCPLDDDIYTDENTPVTIQLNGTDSRGMELLYSFVNLPRNGQIFYFDTRKTPGIYQAITLNSGPISPSQVTYVPSVNMNGLDDFSFNTVTIDGRISVRTAKVTLHVRAITNFDITLDSANFSIELISTCG
jgi:hypothetical protein